MSATVSSEDAINAQLDFRAFIDVLRQDGDLAEVNIEVDPHLEVASIVRRISEINGKAPLFNNVKGAKDGLWRMFGNAASLRSNEKEKFGRIARNLGLPKTASWKDISERTQAGKKAPIVPPRVLETGPCKQNKIEGDDIDLHSLPAPYLHEGDGGKYLQTYGIHVLQSPDKKWTNWSIFRGMIHDSRRIVCLVGTGQHNSIIRQKWMNQGATEMPWALAMGVPPVANLVAALPVPEGVSEGEYVGALTGRPLDLVKCELSDLLVPANSEIVLEGTFSFVDKAAEGPFGDFLGIVFDNDTHPMPLFTVNCITYRDDAIMPISVPGRITDESHTTAALAAAELLTYCQAHELPIKEASACLETMGTWCALQVDGPKLRALKTKSKDFVKRIGDIIFANKSTMLLNKIILVGDDVDPYDFKEVMWAYSTRCRPGHDEYPFDDVAGFPLTPYMSHGRGDKHRGGKIISDCLLPMEYEGGRIFTKVDFETSYPEEVKRRVKGRWVEMGFDPVD